MRLAAQINNKFLIMRLVAQSFNKGSGWFH